MWIPHPSSHVYGIQAEPITLEYEATPPVIPIAPPETRACPRCGSSNDVSSQYCSQCAQPLHSPVLLPPQGQSGSNYPRPPQQASAPIQVPAGSHSVALVAVLSILFGGWVGMLVNRQYVKGIVTLVGFGMIPAAVTCGLSAIVWYPLSVIDAILVANRLNRGEAISEWQCF